MFEFKRAKRVHEQIKLGDEVITINLDAESIAIEFNKRRNELIRAEMDIKQIGKEDPAVMEKYGTAVVSLFQLLFGDENTEKILAFYENRYVEMSMEVFPFILEVIAPQISQAVEEMRKRAKTAYRNIKK